MLQASRPAAAASWNPTNISGMAMFIESDSGCTSTNGASCVDGDILYLWNDLSGNRNNIYNAFPSASKAWFRTNIMGNGKPSIMFQEAVSPNKFYFSNTIPCVPATIFIVFKNTNGAASASTILGSQSVNRQLGVSDYRTLRTAGNASPGISYTVTNTLFRTYEWWITSSNGWCGWNGSYGTTNVRANSGFDLDELVGYTQDGGPGIGAYITSILIWTNQLSASDALNTRTYLTNKWGL